MLIQCGAHPNPKEPANMTNSDICRFLVLHKMIDKMLVALTRSKIDKSWSLKESCHWLESYACAGNSSSRFASKWLMCNRGFFSDDNKVDKTWLRLTGTEWNKIKLQLLEQMCTNLSWCRLVIDQTYLKLNLLLEIEFCRSLLAFSTTGIDQMPDEVQWYWTLSQSE